MGLNLTEDLLYVLLHPFQNMKTMTTRGLPLLLLWASQQTPGREVGGVNILCSDFVDISQFCSLVIGLNSKLLRGAGPGRRRPWACLSVTVAIATALDIQSRGTSYFSMIKWDKTINSFLIVILLFMLSITENCFYFVNIKTKLLPTLSLLSFVALETFTSFNTEPEVRGQRSTQVYSVRCSQREKLWNIYYKSSCIG